jgi:hypothetical protein
MVTAIDAQRRRANLQDEVGCPAVYAALAGAARGAASIEFLGASGKVVRTEGPPTSSG